MSKDEKKAALLAKLDDPFDGAILDEPFDDSALIDDEELIIADDSFKPALKTVESSREELENNLLEALFDVLKNGKIDQKLKGIKEAGDLLGLKEQSLKNISAENVQVNVGPKPEISDALVKSLNGIKSVAEGSANKIVTQKGGKGV